MWNKLYEKYPDNLLFKLMANKRFSSLIYLIMWFIAILIMYFIFIAPFDSDQNNLNTTNEVETIEDIEITPFETMKNNLLENNYSYVYHLNDDVIYRGDVLGTQTAGYQETYEGIKRYYIDGDKAYNVNFGVLTEIDYEEVFKTYFNVSYIFSLIENHSPIIVDNIYSYKIDSNYINIVTDSENIQSIEISWDENKYVLELSNIGKITEISY